MVTSFSTLYVPSVQTYSIYFDMASEKLQPLQLRQAIMYAMNREEISDGTFNGWGSITIVCMGSAIRI